MHMDLIHHTGERFQAAGHHPGLVAGDDGGGEERWVHLFPFGRLRRGLSCAGSHGR
jgi:hypothetical protein